jgi:hypothetical protein
MTAPALRPRRVTLAAPAVCAGLTLCFGVATCVVGWWGVPVVGLAWGVWSGRNTKPPVAAGLTAATCAVVAWAVLLAWTAALGPLPLLARTLGAVAGVPGAALIVMTLVFAGVLAWSATAATAAERP